MDLQIYSVYLLFSSSGYTNLPFFSYKYVYALCYTNCLAVTEIGNILCIVKCKTRCAHILVHTAHITFHFKSITLYIQYTPTDCITFQRNCSNMCARFKWLWLLVIGVPTARVTHKPMYMSHISFSTFV